MKPLLILLSLIPVFSEAANGGHIGSPDRVTCFAKASVAAKPIRGMTNINELLRDRTIREIGQVHPTCRKFAGQVTSCEAVIENNKLAVRYSFNTQSGDLLIIDYDLGLAAETNWMNQDQVTKSGYLTAFATLTSLKGGLLGENQVFEVLVSCKATDEDWKVAP